jgi:hypothetical protein
MPPKKCYNGGMADKSNKHPGRRGNPVSASPLSMDQLVDGIFKIKPADVKRIVASRPGKKRKK